MLGKLIKYEIKATSRWLLPIYILALLLAPIERLAIHYIGNNLDSLETNPAFDRIANTLFFIITMTFVVALITVAVASGLLLIYRFYKNLVTNEGYLMHTLPVKTGQLIWSKAIAAILWTIVSGIVILLSILLLVIGTPGWSGFTEDLGYLVSNLLQHFTGKVWLLFIELLLGMILSGLSSIFMVYASIALGQLITKHKILGSFGAYFLLNTGLQFVTSLFMLPSINWFLSVGSAATAFNNVLYKLIPMSLLYTAALTAVFYFITSYIFKKKLNLE